jgi:hypothetical protein
VISNTTETQCLAVVAILPALLAVAVVVARLVPGVGAAWLRSLLGASSGPELAQAGGGQGR